MLSTLITPITSSAPKSAQARIVAAGLTDRGKCRGSNQDRFAVCPDIDEAAKRLVDFAKHQGGSDNMTAVLVHWNAGWART